MSSTRLEHKMSTCLVLDICIKISHVEHSKVDIFSGRSRMHSTWCTQSVFYQMYSLSVFYMMYSISVFYLMYLLSVFHMMYPISVFYLMYSPSVFYMMYLMYSSLYLYCLLGVRSGMVKEFILCPTSSLLNSITGSDIGWDLFCSWEQQKCKQKM